MADVRIGRIVCFLTDVKSEICLEKGKNGAVGGCGYIAAMTLFDKTIEMLIRQQTNIENLENLLSIEREENNRYHEKYGEIDFEEGGADNDTENCT